MTDTPQTPIVVKESAAKPLFWSCVRIGLFIAAGMMLRPYVPETILGIALPHIDQAVAALVALAPTLWVSLRDTWSKHRKLVVAAEAAPADVAVVVK